MAGRREATVTESDYTMWHWLPALGVNVMVFVIVFQTAGCHKPLRKAAYYLLLKTRCILYKDLYRRGKNINISSFHTIVDITPVPFAAYKDTHGEEQVDSFLFS
jgi:hypothetical protein